eukprot:961025-Prorocentrum_minimum.AAC.1
MTESSIQSKKAAVAARASRLRSNLVRSYEATDQLCVVLDAFDKRTEELEQLMLPIQARVHTLSRGQERLSAAIHHCADMLHHVDLSRQLETKILEGPRGDFGAYLAHVSKLDNAVTQMAAFPSPMAASARKHAADLQAKARALCE